MDRYVEFASLYDDLMNDFDYKSWVDYIEDIYLRYNRQPRNILEMACGTGSLSYYLAIKKYNLICFDLSSEMLSKAYEKLGRFNNVKLLNQNMVDFNINKKFDSVISVCDSINYITEEDDLFSSFKNVYNHLNEDGIFIFDINSYFKLKNVLGNNTFSEDRGDIFYCWQNFFDENTDICEFYLTFFKSENMGKTYSRFDEEHKEKAYTVEKITELLKKAGFSIVDTYEAFTFKNIKENTERINFVVIK